MNENDNLNLNENESSQPDTASQSGNAFESEAQGYEEAVRFNEDGTYHERFAPNSPDNGNTQSESSRSPQTNNDRYPYNNNNSYPYGNNNSYSYGNNNSYSYGNNNSYPYGNTGNGYGNVYPPERNEHRYAYSDDSYSGGGNKKKNSKGAKVFAILAGVLCVFLVAVLIAVITGGSVHPVVSDETTTKNNPENVEEIVTNASPVTGEQVNAEGEMSPKAIYNKVLPSSVGILVYDKSKTLASEGSGVLFKESIDGKYTYIITCAHVISNATGKIRVQLSDSSEYEAVVVGYDARTDIGVIRIEESGLTLAEIGDSSKIFVGDPIYAIGNPGGVEFANSFTNGMVSALDRPVNSSSTGYTTECIQHTAAINPGNSGGALVNAFGQVIGINSMKIVADEYEGMGFAVPSSVFVKIVNEILENGYVTNRPKLGITYVAASEYSTYGMFVAIKGLPSGTIVIYDIAADSAFAGTKVEKGDMITAVNGAALDDPSYISELIEEMNVGDKLTLTIVRLYDDYSSEEFDVTVTLVEDRGDTMIQQEEEETTLPGTYPGGGYEDYFDKYFEDYFNDFFGDYAP